MMKQCCRFRKFHSLQHLIITLFLAFSSHLSQASDEFSPYQLNGGLVAAVAGRNYCIVATDTRLMEGYEILTRQHLSSRLWCASGHHDAMVAKDGSIQVPQQESTTTTSPMQSLFQKQQLDFPVWIATAGCNADCEALKRMIRSDVRAASFAFGQPMQANQVASLLSQVLYHRRSFPFYSFCVVSGMENGQGVAYQYDAIGSHEQLAVATSGTGRELLQPILDRMFATTTRSLQQEQEDTKTENANVVKSSPMHKKLHVECNCNEAMDILIRAYQSVAEREIGIGDNLVLCITTCDETKQDLVQNVRVKAVSLKPH